MVLFGFGNYDYACHNIPSLPTCNLFVRQLLYTAPNAPATAILGLPAVSDATYSSALAAYPVGVNAACAIARMGRAGGQPGSLGNIAQIILCSISVIVALVLAAAAHRRTAAVGKSEMSILFVLYGLLQGLALLTTGAFLQAGAEPLTILSAIHLGLVVAFFWTLAWAAFLSLQVVEDGGVSSLAPLFVGFVILWVGSSYIFADTAFGITNYFQPGNQASLHSAWLFVLTIIWPAVATAFYFIVQLGVVVRVLRERKPAFLFLGAIVLFILGQASYYALSYKICTGTHRTVDGSFLATLFETAAIITLFFAWNSITESSWDDFELA